MDRGQPARNRFLRYYAPNAVHEPIVPNPRFTGSRFGKLWRLHPGTGLGAWGQILAQIDKLKLADNTLVIFDSDNGGVVNPGNESASRRPQAASPSTGRYAVANTANGRAASASVPRALARPKSGRHRLATKSSAHRHAGNARQPAERAAAEGNAEDSFDVLRAFTETKPGPPVRDHVILQAADATYDIRMGD